MNYDVPMSISLRKFRLFSVHGSVLNLWGQCVLLLFVKRFKWLFYCFPHFRNVPISTPVSVTRAGVASTVLCLLPGPPRSRHAPRPPGQLRPSREPRPRGRSPQSLTLMCVSIPRHLCNFRDNLFLGLKLILREECLKECNENVFTVSTNDTHSILGREKPTCNFNFTFLIKRELSHINAQRHFSILISKLLSKSVFISSNSMIKRKVKQERYTVFI